MAKEGKVKNGIVETIKTIIYALIIAGIFRTVFFQPFWIPSGSMKDTLLIGDFLFVNKMAYGYSYASCPSIRIPAMGIDIDAEDFCGVFRGGNQRLWGGEPERGDVVVFRHPVDGRDFIKRLVGLPGDRIQVRDGVLYINDEAAGQQDAGVFEEVMERQGPQGLQPRCADIDSEPLRLTRVGLGGVCSKQRYTETLPGGHSHSILNIVDQGPESTDNTQVFTVPEGHYFFMGDNRDNSTDSRVPQRGGGLGFVPYEDLIGRADRVMFSSSGRSMLAFWTWRSDRYFKAIE